MMRSSISQLPESIRRELDRRLINSSFSGYQELTIWLIEQGFEISKSSVHRYGQQFQVRLELLKEVTEQARAVAEVAGDDDNSLGDALTRLAQQKAFEALLHIEEVEKISLPKLGRMIADLNRSSVTVKRHRAEVLEKLDAKLKALETESKEGKGHLDAATLQRVREEIYGIN